MNVRSPNLAARLCTHLALGLAGAYCVVLASRATDAWLWMHVILPHWYLPPTSLAAAHGVRWGAGVFGLLLATLAALRIGRWAGTQRWKTLAASGLRIAAAVVLAVLFSEALVRRWDGYQPLWRKGKLEFRIGQADERLGWIPIPSHSTLAHSGRAKAIHYQIDTWGYRSAREDSTPDPELPSLIVSGESIAFGHGLEYEDTFAAVLGKRLGLQVVNAAMAGYASDQAYMRVVDALGRLKHPVAVVTVFIPLELRRSLQDYRPRLVLRGEKLEWQPGAAGFWARWRLRDLFVNELPYLSDRALSRALALNAALVRATGAAARGRGAEPLFLLPSFIPPGRDGERVEGPIVQELFVRQREPYLIVDFDRAQLIPDDWHPNAAASREIAARIEQVLKPRVAR